VSTISYVTISLKAQRGCLTLKLTNYLAKIKKKYDAVVATYNIAT